MKSHSADQRRWLLLAIVLSFAVRLAIAGCSWGTSDTLSFLRFAGSIDRVGLLATYRTDSELNHPPIPAYWAYLAWLSSGRSAYLCAFLFRLPMILADSGSVWLLTKIGRGKSGVSPLQTAALFAWCPAAILISAYHGNTDSIYAFLCLLCVYLLDADLPLVAGLALAAAINVKLIPILLILPLVLSPRKWSDAGRFIAGLLPGILPFLIPLIGAPASYAHNALAYASRFDLWGINLFLGAAASDSATLPYAVVAYRTIGRFLIIAMVIAWSILARFRNRPNRHDLAAVTFAIFLIFAPGFGVQYLVILLPLLFAARPRLATVFGLLAGVFLLAAYAIFWDGGFPLSSLFNRTFPPILGYIGAPVWCVLVYYLTIVLTDGKKSKRNPKTADPS
jgi:Glycosyltransferase family 87